ncbi:MAG: hypothetical protein KatS3mg119_0772 [Rhodothalassiaceae bacterium]|nr:MAG: hypothetical protein KatS3mg119_0772 [Rhodothalassiaceae bacterium]
MTDLPPLPQDPPADADWLVIPRGPLPAARRASGVRCCAFTAAPPSRRPR